MSFVEGFTGTYEMTCTDVQDDTGTYDTTFCPEVTVVSFCAPLGTQIPEPQILFYNTYLFNPNETGDYCYCAGVKVLNFLPDGYSARIPDNPTEIAGVIINQNGACAGTDANSIISPEPFPDSYPFYSSQSCVYNCSILCNNFAKNNEVSIFPYLVHDAPNFVGYYAK